MGRHTVGARPGKQTGTLTAEATRMRVFFFTISVLSACGGVPSTQQKTAEPAGSTAPISVEDGIWTWVPFSDALCADGSTTGLGIHRNGDDKTLLLYLQGGGACWDAESCYGPFAKAVSIVGGYGYSQF